MQVNKQLQTPYKRTTVRCKILPFFTDLLGKPVVVGHGPRLQGLGRLLVHQRTAPVVFPIVPGVRDVDDVVTGHTQRWWLTVRLYVEINPHIEGVRTHKAGC